jgi:pyruvate ferredoxin oxidoreductase delta subunit
MAANTANKLKTYKEIPIGGLVETPGSSSEFKTGDWRSSTPMWNKAKCINCMMCYNLCPENCILMEKDASGNPKIKGIDLDYCKGCGICTKTCPVKCITMKTDDRTGDKQ